MMRVKSGPFYRTATRTYARVVIDALKRAGESTRTYYSEPRDRLALVTFVKQSWFFFFYCYEAFMTTIRDTLYSNQHRHRSHSGARPTEITL